MTVVEVVSLIGALYIQAHSTGTSDDVLIASANYFKEHLPSMLKQNEGHVALMKDMLRKRGIQV